MNVRNDIRDIIDIGITGYIYLYSGIGLNKNKINIVAIELETVENKNISKSIFNLYFIFNIIENINKIKVRKA